jgi:hypothetical protein
MRRVEITLSLIAGAFVVYMAILSVIEDEAHAESSSDLCCEWHRDFVERLWEVENPCVLAFMHNADYTEGVDCCETHGLFWAQLEETDIFVMPCANCVMDRSETPYCQNLCGPTPYVGLSEVLDDMGAP